MDIIQNIFPGTFKRPRFLCGGQLRDQKKGSCEISFADGTKYDKIKPLC
jgi:hypothetical protein